MKIKKDVKGITLIALVVTIIIIIILVSVTINITFRSGLFERAKGSVNIYKTAEENETEQLNNIPWDSYLPEGGEKTGEKILIKNLRASGEIVQTSEVAYDDFDNEVWIPANFKVPSDSATVVTGGVVIEDASTGDSKTTGSQFVWIPIGTGIKKDETNTIDITLGRYTFDELGTKTLVQNATDYATKSAIDYYVETATNDYGNAIAKDLPSFITSATTKGGYYLARYEAGVGTNETLDKTDMVDSTTAPNTNWTGYKNGTLVSQAGKQAWNYVTQKKASDLSKGMYSSIVNSDLVNSYAWDTAIVFIEQCGTASNHSNYANQKGESEDNSLGRTGTKKLKSTNDIDIQCNIYDMSGSVREWTTESSNYEYPYVVRGANCYDDYDCTNTRWGGYNADTAVYDNYGFRPILYL